ncbi:hypothetical protein [Thomasclavelia sp.]|uniref:hypothetical protein n=1 Tax=Thomasclavelia sp. TaxID=3025757 RepID=UPI0025E1B21E|nr:hypothetical protein [Thomasclavelia sp.]
MPTKKEAIMNEISSLEIRKNILECKDFLDADDRAVIDEITEKITALKRELEKW